MATGTEWLLSAKHQSRLWRHAEGNSCSLNVCLKDPSAIMLAPSGRSVGHQDSASWGLIVLYKGFHEWLSHFSAMWRYILSNENIIRPWPGAETLILVSWPPGLWEVSFCLFWVTPLFCYGSTRWAKVEATTLLWGQEVSHRAWHLAVGTLHSRQWGQHQSECEEWLMLAVCCGSEWCTWRVNWRSE